MLYWSRALADYLVALEEGRPVEADPEILFALVNCGFVVIVAGVPELTVPAGRDRVRELTKIKPGNGNGRRRRR